MNGMLVLVLAFIAGLALGAFYFGGLWLTVRRLAETSRTALWFGASFVIRTGVTLIAFYFVMGGRWERMVACLIGFLIVRQVLIHRLKPA